MDEFFDLPATRPSKPDLDERGRPRLQRPNRNQLILAPSDLEALLPADHRARLVWAFVEGLDLEPLYETIRATEGHPGRPPIDPAILTALWLYATLDGVGSARALDRLAAEHDAYRWLCGGVSVNYHSLADFRVGHEAFLDGLLTQSVAALVGEGLVSLNRVAQDGIRVRAAAGVKSFRRGDALTAALADAEAQVAALKTELDDDPGATSRRVAAARQRATSERLERVRRALAALPEIEAMKRRRPKPSAARVSTTDPQAQVMKMPAGGFSPAYNGQLASDTASQIIVGLDLSNQGDRDALGPMVDQLARRYGRRPREYLADGGFINRPQIERLAGSGTTVYLPVRAPRKTNPRGDRYARHWGDTAAVIAWRTRMATAAAQRIYRERAATAECVNALARNRGLVAFRVRGLRKAKAVLLWYALAHNLLRAASLRRSLAAA
jgi:transposase